MTRECGNCTKCCEGWLCGSAHGHKFYPGRPCHFVCESGCSIYKDRPENPCKTFHCMWLKNKELPEWLKPNLSHVIVIKRYDKNIGEYIEVNEAGQKIDSNVLSWFFEYYLNTRINMTIKINGSWMNYGTDEFLKFRDVL